MLRHLTRFLDNFGYRVLQAAGDQQGRAALEGEAPDLIIVDAELAPQSGAAWCAAVRREWKARNLYILMVTRGGQPQDLVQAIEAGVDDFIHKPLNHGEILTRLRTGARVLEYERRVFRRRARDPLTGLLGETAFHEMLKGELALTRGKPRQLSCVMIDVDFFHRFNRELGRIAGDVVLAAVGKALAELTAKPAVATRLGQDRFAVLLADTSTDKAMKWAEKARVTLSELEIPHHDATLRLTVSVGVAGFQASKDDPEALLEHARESLEAAKQSGRNCVARFGEYVEEIASWAELAAPGKLFERTTVRDVMTPCTVSLRPDETVGQAVTLFRQTQMEAIPVVDDKDALVGLVTNESVRKRSTPGQSISQIMSKEISRFEETVSFSKLMDFFSSDSKTLTMIVQGKRPSGFVTRDSLRALIEPISADTFTESGESETGDNLLVPDLCLAQRG
jgi:two-component system chemotaxis response regulator CheY